MPTYRKETEVVGTFGLYPADHVKTADRIEHFWRFLPQQAIPSEGMMNHGPGRKGRFRIVVEFEPDEV